MEWLLAIIDAMAVSDMKTATVIAVLDIPWPNGMAEPEYPQMAVGQIMKRFFKNLKVVRENAAQSRTTIVIDDRRGVTRWTSPVCTRDKESSKTLYFSDDEGKTCEF